jgi:hypothetical protein
VLGSAGGEIKNGTTFQIILFKNTQKDIVP